MPPKKAKKEAPPARGSFENAMSDILKKCPGVTVLPSDKAPKIERLRTGLFVFDLNTGGGLPYNRLTMYHGKKSTGKSTKLAKDINRFLLEHPDKIAVIIDAEHTYDPEWCAIHIPVIRTQPNRLYIIKPIRGEDGVDSAIKAAESSNVGFVAVDSVAMLVPFVEIEKTSADSIVGRQAKLISNLVRRATVALSQASREGRKLIILLVNQERAYIGGMMPGMYSKPGGFLQDSAASLDVRFKTQNYRKVGDRAVKVTHEIVVEKNKVGVPKSRATFHMYLADYDGFSKGDYDEIDDVTKCAGRAKIIYKENGKIFMKGYPKKFDSTAELIEELKGDRELFESLKDVTLDTLLKLDSVDDQEEESVEGCDD